MNYEAEFLQRLETILTGMGGTVPAMTTPANFQARSLQLLDAIAAAPGGGGDFDYDQEAVPAAPSMGETWIERRANGLVREIWQWSGSLWIAFTREVYSGFHTNVSSSQSGSVANARLNNATGSTPLGSLIVERVFCHGRAGVTDPVTSSWTVGLSTLTRGNALIQTYTQIPGTSVVVTTSGDFTLSAEPNVAVSAATGLAALATFATLAGASGGSLGCIVTAETRRVRP